MDRDKIHFLTQGAHYIQCAPCSDFTLYDSRGRCYYVRTLPNGVSKIKVNIHHADTYTGNVDFSVLKTEELEPGKHIELPHPERFRLRPITIVYNPSLRGTPARIFTDHYPARIEIGTRFFKFPLFARAFILYHEYGHLFYQTEWKTDQFALRIFLAQGFSPSQAFYALSKVLGRSDQNAHRIINQFVNLQKNGYVANENK